MSDGGMDSGAWEQAALYRAIYCNEAADVFRHCTVADFTPVHMDLALVASKLHSDKTPAQTALAEVQRVGGKQTFQQLLDIQTAGDTYFASGAYYGRMVRENAAKRALAVVGAQFSNAINNATGENLWLVRDQALQAIQQISPPGDEAVDDYYDLDYFTGLADEDVPYTFPGMLRKGERFLMIGMEGGGKSSLVYQLLTAASYGVDSLNDGYPRYEPQSVLFLDVENSPHQIAWNVKSVVRTLQEMAPDVKPQWKNLRRKIIDLTQPAEAAHLIRSVVRHNPDILYMGSAYKMAFAQDYREMGRAIMSTVDRIRAEIECTFIIEHHAGHGDQNNRNGWRADGSSEWGRWADFARGMDVKFADNGKRVMKLAMSSRYDRSTNRTWPVGLIQHSIFPWRAMWDADEFDYHFGKLFPNDDDKRRK